MNSPGSLAVNGAGADAAPPDVSFRLPDIFEQVPSPFGAPAEAEQWERYLDEVLPSKDEAPNLPREEVKQQYTAMRRAEAAQGVIGSAVCCAEVDERLSLAYLTVALAPSRHDDPLVAAEGLYQAELDNAADIGGGTDLSIGDERAVAGQRASPGRVVLAVDLPVGPAVTVVTRNIVTAAPTEEYPDGLQVPTGTVQVFVPTSGSYVAVLTLMTPTPDDLDEYAEVMASIASTVEFSHPEQADQLQ